MSCFNLFFVWVFITIEDENIKLFTMHQNITIILFLFFFWFITICFNIPLHSIWLSHTYPSPPNSLFVFLYFSLSFCILSLSHAFSFFPLDFIPKLIQIKSIITTIKNHWTHIYSTYYQTINKVHTYISVSVLHFYV